MGNSQQVFQSIFNRSMFENGSKDFLTAIAKQYPYFTAAQFYLLQKSEPASDDYNKQLAKAAILFNNPFWLNYQLEQSFGSEDLSHELITQQVAQNESSLTIEVVEPETRQHLFESAESIPELELLGNQANIEEEISFENNTDAPYEDSPQIIGTPEMAATADQNVETNGESKEEFIENENSSQRGPTFQTAPTVAGEIIQINPEVTIEDKTVESVGIRLETIIPDLPAIFTPTEVSGVPENNESYEGVTAQINRNTSTEAGIESALTILSPQSDQHSTDLQNVSENDPQESGEELSDREIEPLRFTLNFTNATATTEDTVEFEPLHTSDYFAAMGIKFSDEIKPDDKLGRHLKSFTEWLKTMKKIHPDQLPQPSEQSETIIQQMAEKSNTEGDVLTETMAEVLLQQGKVVKAIEVYQKLSLLNPLKSAYFAAKIDKIEK